MTPRRDDLLTVQALRAVAALLVVAYHGLDQWATHAGGQTADAIWPNGSAGVDIFFVISGLVMTISARRVAERAHAWRIFMTQRLKRIMPLYWLVTTAKIAAVIALPALATRTRLDLPYVIASYALLPVRDWTGEIRPVLPVGWTLSYEMLFYLLVTCALAARVPILRVALPALAVFAAGAILTPAAWGFLNTIVLEFLFGVLLGIAIHRGLRAPRPVAVALLLVGSVAIVLMPPVSGLLRPLTWGVPAAGIVAGAVLLEKQLAPVLPRWLLAAGDASYATYLTHGFVVPLVFLVARHAGLQDMPLLVVTLLGSLFVSALVGQATHVWVERPMTNRLRRRPPIPTVAVVG